MCTYLLTAQCVCLSEAAVQYVCSSYYIQQVQHNACFSFWGELVTYQVSNKIRREQTAHRASPLLCSQEATPISDASSGLLPLAPPPLRKRSNSFAAKLIIRQKATLNVSKVVKISFSYLNSAMTQSFHMYTTQVQRYMPVCSRPCKLWRGSRPRRQDLTTHILRKLGQKPRPSIFPRKPLCTIPEAERSDHIHIFWAMTGILDKALSNLVWPYSWLRFEQEVGIEASWGLFQPELWTLGSNE